jgi:YidC/Oxa1 family membrane protein insertase
LAEHHNPNQQGSSDSRSTISLVLVVMLAFLGWQYFSQKSATNTPASNAPAATAPAAPAPSGTSNPIPAAAATKTFAAATTQPVVAAPDEAETTIENELYRITFTNRGAHVVSWVLKRYKDAQGKPLDLVDPDVAAKYGHPLSLFTYDAALTTRLDAALYQPGFNGAQPTAAGILTPTTDNGATITYDYADGNGLVVHKILHFDSSYIVHADILVTQNGVPIRALVNWPSGFGDPLGQIAASKTRRRFSAGIMQIDQSRAGKTTHVAPNKVSGGATADGELDWVGVSSLYFAADFLPDSPDSATLLTENTTRSIVADPANPNIKQMMPLLGVALGDTSGHTALRIFAGPKDMYVLSTIHPSGNEHANLESQVNLGWSFLSPISKGLFMLLHWTHEHIYPNWGWAIIILTCLITVVMLPLRIYQMRSALKMQRIQPQVTAIRDKYKKYKVTDPQYANMNTEIGALYQKEGVNMFGGCLPLLIQMPLLFAYYPMLASAIELRQAHWLWLPDLSSADPLHIMPILTVVLMFLMQFYTPTPGIDPAQQKMMAFMMPVFFGYICWSYASGLSLYMATSTLINLIQQLVMNRSSLGREMREIAMKRARRKPATINARR